MLGVMTLICKYIVFETSRKSVSQAQVKCTFVPLMIICRLFSSIWVKVHSNRIPRRGSQGGDECLQQPSNEHKGVLPGDDEVECWQDNDGVNQQATYDRHRIHPQLTTHSCNVVHLHNLTSNQEQDTNRGVPEDRWGFTNSQLNHLTPLTDNSPNTYHIIMATSLMMASLRQSKKSFKGCPCSRMLPIIRPKQMENTTRPSALIPFTVPGTGIISSWAICLLPFSVNIVSFTVTVTWITLLAYFVLNYSLKKEKYVK